VLGVGNGSRPLEYLLGAEMWKRKQEEEEMVFDVTLPFRLKVRRWRAEGSFLESGKSSILLGASSSSSSSPTSQDVRVGARVSIGSKSIFVENGGGISRWSKLVKDSKGIEIVPGDRGGDVPFLIELVQRNRKGVIGKFATTLAKVARHFDASTPSNVIKFNIDKKGFVEVEISISQKERAFKKRAGIEELITKLRQNYELVGGIHFSEFEKYDPDGVGQISTSNFFRALRAMKFSLTIAEFKNLTQEIQASKDSDFVNYREFEAFLFQHQSFGEDRRIESQVHSPRDINFEILNFLARARESGVTPKKIFEHFDSSGRGQLRREDFIIGLQDLGIFPTSKETTILFDLLDRNGDDVISLEEFRYFAGESISSPESKEEFTNLQREEKTAPRSEKLENASKSVLEQEAIWEEKRKVRDQFVDEVVACLVARFGKSLVEGESKRRDVDLQEQAHIAFEHVLEQRLAKSQEKCRNLKNQLIKQKQIAEIHRQKLAHLESFLLQHADSFAPKIASCSRRCSKIARKFISALSESKYCGFEELFQGKLGKRRATCTFEDLGNLICGELLTEDDMLVLETDFKKQNWCEPFIVRVDGVCYCAQFHLAQGLEKCKEKDMRDLMERTTTMNEMPQILHQLMKAAENTDPRRWFVAFKSGDGDISGQIPFKDLLRSLETANVPMFGSEKQYDQCLDWIERNASFETQKLRDQQKIDVETFCEALYHLVGKESVQRDVDELKLDIRYPLHPQTLNEENKVIDLRKVIPVPCVQFFSSSEHSSNWPPLSKFGQPSVDCVSIVEKGRGVEHHSTRTRPILAFIDGDLSKGKKSLAAHIQIRKEIQGQGIWGLCVTSQPPANRPVRGAAIYTHRGEAKVEGAGANLLENYRSLLLTSYDEDSAFLEEHEIISKNFLQFKLTEKKGNDLAVLQDVYRPFLGKVASADVVETVNRLVEEELDQNRNHQTKNELQLYWKAREIETRIRLFHLEEVQAKIRADHWAFDREYSMASKNLCNSAAHLYGAFKEIIPPRKWAELTKHLQNEKEEEDGRKLSLDEFARILRDFEMKLCQSLNLGNLQVQNFRTNIRKRLTRLPDSPAQTHYAAVDFGSILSCVVDCKSWTASFYVDGIFQTKLKPFCKKPWRFAFFTNRDGGADLVVPKLS